MKNLDIGKIVRWALAIIAVGLVVAVFVWNAVTDDKDVDFTVWNEQMTMGNKTAENHFIEYTDAMCPYCTFFTLALHDNEADFKRDYLDTDKIYFELRLADILVDKNDNSHRANTASYCAAEGGNFWGFYVALQDYLNETYWQYVDWSKVKNSNEKSDMEIIDDQVYLDLASNYAGLDSDEMLDCMDNSKDVQSKLASATTKASTVVTGVPYFVFNNYKSSGFAGDYTTIKQMFKAGGAN